MKSITIELQNIPDEVFEGLKRMHFEKCKFDINKPMKIDWGGIAAVPIGRSPKWLEEVISSSFTLHAMTIIEGRKNLN